MNRCEFLHQTGNWACASCLALLVGEGRAVAADAPTPIEEELKKAKGINTFTKNWLTDLFETADLELDESARMKLIEGCGRGCYRRHAWKHEIAEEGKGDIDRLIASYRKKYFKDTERVGDDIHIRYHGGKCYCPTAFNRPTRPNDLQCECTRANHQAMFEAPLGKKFKAEIVESVRRGGTVCHIVVHLS